VIAIPKDSISCIKIFGIDPGTTKLGLSIMTIDLDHRSIVKTTAMTLNGEKLAHNGFLAEHYSHRLSRIEGLNIEISKLLDTYQPFAISSEAPFFNVLRPSAFAPLMETICSLRSTLYNYDPFKPLNMVDPSSVKNAVGAKGGSNKVTVRAALLELPDLCYHGTVPIEDLDEHSIDSIAVNYWYFNKYIR